MCANPGIGILLCRKDECNLYQNIAAQLHFNLQLIQSVNCCYVFEETTQHAALNLQPLISKIFHLAT